MKCCSPFDVDSVKACPVASNCTIFPVATSVVGVCDFDLVGLAAGALVGWVVDYGFAAGDDVAARAEAASDRPANASARGRMTVCMCGPPEEMSDSGRRMINGRAASAASLAIGLSAAFDAIYTMSARFNGRDRSGTAAPARQI